MSNLPATTLETINRLYHRDYYLRDCEGHREFRRSGGRKLSRRLSKVARLVDPGTGTCVVDIGCGRGELSCHIARHGATVVAIDPSSAAHSVMKEMSAANDSRILALCARGEQLPVRSRWADVVVLSDVVEHIPKETLPSLLEECHRVLRPDGRLVVHTQPNRVLLDVTVPLLSRFSRLWNVELPRDLRSEMSTGAGPDYHVYEQSLRSLRRLLRGARFQIDELWLEGSYPIHRIFGEAPLKKDILAAFRRWQVLKELLASQLFAIARRSAFADAG